MFTTPKILQIGLGSVLAIAILAAPGFAAAQQMPLDGSRPPVISVEAATRTVPNEGGLPVPAADVSATNAVETTGVLEKVIAVPERPKAKPAVSHAAPPSVLEVESGQNYTYGMSLGHINRIVTPFQKPALRTTSTASTSIEGSIVYIASNVDQPIGLFIFDEASPEHAISLTLIPGEMAPISTSVHVRGWSGSQGSNLQVGNSKDAAMFEGSQPYLETLTVLLRDIARGQLPDGYGLEKVRNPGSSLYGECSIPGVHVVPLQVVIGGVYKTIVARATNTGFVNAEIREEQCNAPGLRAVASWPKTRLAPGESTELYLVVGTAEQHAAVVTRPSVLGDY